VDLVAEGYDAGIRLSEIIDRDMVSVQLTKPVRLVVVGTPESSSGASTSKPMALSNFRLLRNGSP